MASSGFTSVYAPGMIAVIDASDAGWHPGYYFLWATFAPRACLNAVWSLVALCHQCTCHCVNVAVSLLLGTPCKESAPPTPVANYNLSPTPSTTPLSSSLPLILPAPPEPSSPLAAPPLDIINPHSNPPTSTSTLSESVTPPSPVRALLQIAFNNASPPAKHTAPKPVDSRHVPAKTVGRRKGPTELLNMADLIPGTFTRKPTSTSIASSSVTTSQTSSACMETVSWVKVAASDKENAWRR